MTSGYDAGPVHLGPLADERHRPVSARRKKVGLDIRVDATRVSGPIRLVLEPFLWVAFAVGVMWLVVGLQPEARMPVHEGVILNRHLAPLAVGVGGLVLLSSISALLWVPGATTAARSRTALTGMAMLASGWLFTAVQPVDSSAWEFHSRFSFAVGILLVVICAVPWPTRPAVQAGKMTRVRGAAVALLVLASLAVVTVAVREASPALFGVGGDVMTAWREVIPPVAVIAALLAAVRIIVRRPAAA